MSASDNLDFIDFIVEDDNVLNLPLLKESESSESLINAFDATG